VENDKYLLRQRESSLGDNKVDLDEVFGVSELKYDALNWKWLDKTWEETQDIWPATKEPLNHQSTQREDVLSDIVMNSFARSIEAQTSYLSPRKYRTIPNRNESLARR